MKDQIFLSTRRILWTAGVGFAGFLIGGIGAMARGSAVGLLWGATIGYGFGSIFDQKRARKALVVYWGITLAMVGPFFGLIIGAILTDEDYSFSKQLVSGGVGAVIGMLLGLLIGAVQLKGLRGKSPTWRVAKKLDEFLTTQIEAQR